VGPRAPVAPFAFQESDRSLWRHFVASATTRSWPFGFFAQALITEDVEASRDAAAASAPPPIAAAARPAASSRIPLRLKLPLTPTPSVVDGAGVPAPSRRR